MKYILLTGHRKSGTSLLHKLFDGHSQLNVYPVDLCFLYAFFPYWTNIVSSNSEEKAKRFKLVLEKSTSEFQGLKISSKINSFDVSRFYEVIFEIKNPAFIQHPSEIIELISKAYCEYADLNPELPFVFKETSQAVNLRFLRKYVPHLKCLQIIRDPRDNYAAIKGGVSTYYSKMNEGNLECLASLINRVYFDLKIAANKMSSNDDMFFSITFEELVINPQKTMIDVSKMLDIELESCLFEPTFLGKPYTGNSFSTKIIKGISSKNVGRWRSKISADEAKVIEFYLGDLMNTWGYELHSSYNEQLEAIATFYSWYNCRYFYSDSFSL